MCTHIASVISSCASAERSSLHLGRGRSDTANVNCDPRRIRGTACHLHAKERRLLAPKSSCFMAIGLAPNATPPASATLTCFNNDRVNPMLDVVLTFPSGRSPQLNALFTSAPILASSAAVNSVSAKAVGHM
jgi:hypothetical protein